MSEDAKEVQAYTQITLDYPIIPIVKPKNQYVEKAIEAGGVLFYQEQLEKFNREYYRDLKVIPWWDNPFFSGLDGVVLYCYLRELRPTRYVEIGSGISTMFARKAAIDGDFPLTIVSIDPQPRADVEKICDEVIRYPLEMVDPEDFEYLEDGDVFFFDGSHRVFQNSDVVCFFMDVLPILKRGVYVHMHDINLPYDYHEDWIQRFYSEQYMLAAFLMGGHRGYKIMMPNAYACGRGIVPKRFNEFGAFGGSFWLKKE